MSNLDIPFLSMAFIIDVIFTIIEFEIVPFFWKVIKKDIITKKHPAFFSIMNSILVYATLLCIEFFLFKNGERYNILIYFIIGYCCGLINYYWLKGSNK